VPSDFIWLHAPFIFNAGAAFQRQAYLDPVSLAPRMILNVFKPPLCYLVNHYHGPRHRPSENRQGRNLCSSCTRARDRLFSWDEDYQHPSGK